MRIAITDEHGRRWFRRRWTFGAGSGAQVLVHALLEMIRQTAGDARTAAARPAATKAFALEPAISQAASEAISSPAVTNSPAPRLDVLRWLTFAGGVRTFVAGGPAGRGTTIE